jgi:hypothetical protein
MDARGKFVVFVFEKIVDFVVTHMSVVVSVTVYLFLEIRADHGR